jgi:hypothetical protein
MLLTPINKTPELSEIARQNYKLDYVRQIVPRAMPYAMNNPALCDISPLAGLDREKDFFGVVAKMAQLVISGISRVIPKQHVVMLKLFWLRLDYGDFRHAFTSGLLSSRAIPHNDLTCGALSTPQTTHPQPS